METKKRLLDIEELLEVDAGSLTHETDLSSLPQWDSLAFVSFIAMADSNYSVSIAPADLRKCGTVGQLVSLLEAK